jgi:L-seryl-tRNA(Ser) seleniumtransferase
VLLIDDLGSGTLLDTSTYGLASEPPVQESVAAGADLVTFSGDKLLGGPQAGIIVGKAALIERLRTHPMARALRVDKLTLAALEGTLHSYRRGAAEEIPVWQMIAASAEQLRQRAAAWQNALQAKGIAGDVWPSESAVGGGSLPGETLPTFVLAVPAFDAEAAAARLRQGEPAVLCRIQKDRLLFDPRTVLPAQDETLLAQIAAALPEGRP